MIALFNVPYRPRNYSQEEVTALLETIDLTDRKQFIARNYNQLTTAELMAATGYSEATVFRLMRLRGIKKKRNVKFRDHQETTIVFNNQTGIYYSSISQAAETVGLNKSTFRDCISGRRVNNFTSIFKIV